MYDFCIIINVYNILYWYHSCHLFISVNKFTIKIFVLNCILMLEFFLYENPEDSFEIRNTRFEIRNTRFIIRKIRYHKIKKTSCVIETPNSAKWNHLYMILPVYQWCIVSKLVIKLTMMNWFTQNKFSNQWK